MIPANGCLTYEIIYNTYSLSQAPPSLKLLQVWDKNSPLYDEHLKYWFIWKGL